jgi:hypothetical protein
MTYLYVKRTEDPKSLCHVFYYYIFLALDYDFEIER